MNKERIEKIKAALFDYEERAAIIEHDGGASKREAEAEAWKAFQQQIKGDE